MLDDDDDAGGASCDGAPGDAGPCAPSEGTRDGALSPEAGPFAGGAPDGDDEDDCDCGCDCDCDADDEDEDEDDADEDDADDEDDAFASSARRSALWRSLLASSALLTDDASVSTSGAAEAGSFAFSRAMIAKRRLVSIVSSSNAMSPALRPSSTSVVHATASSKRSWPMSMRERSS